MPAGGDDWNRVSRNDYVIFLVCAGVLSLAVLIWALTPWLFLFTGAVAVFATIGRAMTVIREEGDD